MSRRNVCHLTITCACACHFPTGDRTIDPRASRVVELRYFTGLSEREAAEALGVSIAALKRDWAFARAWLVDRLGTGAIGHRSLSP